MKRKIFLGGIIGLLFIGFTGKVVFSEPGSQRDPLISKSYVDSKIDEVKKYLDDSIVEVRKELAIQKPINKEDSGFSNELSIVELKKGQYLIGYSGTEIILRSGRAAAIGSELGGISDITAGKDLDTNESVQKNHLLIIPRSDGRGVYSQTSTFFMVRGDYKIQ